ncbi:hypothetical protein QBC47DRAFT_440091 [Echria macrotheca]|uniref:Uncharacterized protein n=1 Tax=Echria macrotheca TaxID=438768 RepID=A0AAJ0B1Z6_9PEZI|nr:hypothetical protein QBC47DRAFT_440091 [Echria macrotheca]
MSDNHAKLRISHPKDIGSFGQTFSNFLELLALLAPSREVLATISHVTHTTEITNGRLIAVVTITIPHGAEKDFCEAVMDPGSDPAVNAVSEQGLLGFSAVEGDRLYTPWNMSIFQTCYMFGADRMIKFQLQGLKWFSKRELPMWLQLATFAAGTCIQLSFMSTIASVRGNRDAARLIALRQAQTKGRIEWVGGATETGTRLLQAIAKENEKILSEDDQKRLTANAIGDLSRDTADVCELMQGMTHGRTEASQVDEEWDRELPKIFQGLYKLTIRTYTAFSLTEELLNHYLRISLTQGAAAVSSLVNTAACSLQLYLLLEARRAIPTMATALMPAVQSAAAGAVFGLGATIYHGIQAAKAHKRKERCRQLACLIQQIWEAAAETNMFVRWVKTSGTTVVFVQDSGREWEKFLAALKGPGEVREQWKQPRFVIHWVDQRRTALKKLSTEVAAEWEAVCS